jgi:ATP-binding cassette subfamily B protein
MTQNRTCQNSSLSALLIRLWSHLNKRRRRQFLAVIGLMLVSAFAEIISLGALIPFLAALSSPDRVFANQTISSVGGYFGITSPDQVLLPLTIMFACAALSAAGVRLLLLYISTRLAFAAGADLSIEVYRRTLYQPYAVHISRNTSEVIAGITGKVAGVVYGGLLPMAYLLTSGVLLLAVLTALMLIDVRVTLVAALVVGVSYALITKWSRHRLELNGQRIAREETLVHKALQEGLGAIRDVLLDGTQEFYCRVYQNADRPLRQAQGSNQVIASAPRFVIEAVVMVVVATFAYFLALDNEGLISALPVLGAMALGAQRLLQGIQMAYAAWAGMAGSRASLAEAIELLDQPLPSIEISEAERLVHFRDAISLNGICFRYSSQDDWVFRDFNLKIPKGARIGIIGKTGSGKSTLLDLMMGLLVPEHGDLCLGNVRITDANIVTWRKSIAHVPQHIYLADVTIAENIALGVPGALIDFDRVEGAARKAHIEDFINRHPDGYNAMVGERGIRLSGGQRQRIGIARALYKEASVIILDEATSALDGDTETSVMEAISTLGRDLTLIIVAHRLTTLRGCDFIVEIGEGRIKRTGTYTEIIGGLLADEVNEQP